MPALKSTLSMGDVVEQDKTLYLIAETLARFTNSRILVGSRCDSVNSRP